MNRLLPASCLLALLIYVPTVSFVFGRDPIVECRNLPPAEALTSIELESLRDAFIARCDDAEVDYLEHRIVERSGSALVERAGACEVAK